MEYKEVLNAIPFLISSDLSIKEITFEIGYNDTRYFSRLFKELTGKTPVKYRRDELSKRGLKYKQFLYEGFVSKTIKVIEENISDSSLDTEKLSRILNVSKSTLYRKIKMGTGNSTSELIRQIRLNMSQKLIGNDNISTISDLAYDVGYNDPKYFSRCFRQRYGKSPSCFINQQ
jgi:AraC-like DNA-binding protein